MYIDLDAQSRPQNGVVYTVIFTTAGIACILYLEYGVLHITAGHFLTLAFSKSLQRFLWPPRERTPS